MLKLLIFLLFVLHAFSPAVQAQVPSATLIQIVKAEDARKYDAAIESLIRTNNAPVQIRATLAAGRIGNEAAVPVLSSLLERDPSPEVRAMAAFALGEIESIKASGAILRALGNIEKSDAVRARAVEAAGKIAAANVKDPEAAGLGRAVIDTLETEDRRGTAQSRDVILQGITAALRARPDGTDIAAARFLTHADARIRADAGNTLSRVRAKNANTALREMLISDPDPVVRANAARALGAAEDKEAIDVLQQAAVGDDDLRVRVSAIRSLGNLSDPRSGTYLVAYGEALVLKQQREKVRQGRPQNAAELLEIVTAIGRLLRNTENERAIKWLENVRIVDRQHSSETEIALARVTPSTYVERIKTVQPQLPVAKLDRLPAWKRTFTWQKASNIAQGLGELSNSPEHKTSGQKGFASANLLSIGINMYPKATPDILRSYAKFKSDHLPDLLRTQLANKDVFVRAAAAELLAELPASSENADALRRAWTYALETDKQYNDAQLAILDALYKLDKRGSVGSIMEALVAQDFLVRKKALQLLKDREAWKDVAPEALTPVLRSAAEGKDTVWPYDVKSGTRLGQLLYTNADYRRAVLRQNGTVKAVLRTEKGTFTIDLFPEDAPLTVDNFIKLARKRYFNGLEVHRVVPNFVMQDGDPRGDGNGGPGWSIRCEVNTVPYGRGAVGMALSGKDTGGSQWFVTHSPQPHLDGGYTVFGQVNETDMKVVDSIVRGDRIISVQIVEGKPQRSSHSRTRK